MPHHSNSEKPENVSAEIRKLEVRLAEFLEDEEAFVAELRIFIEKIRQLSEQISKAETQPSSAKVKELTQLKLKFAESFNEALKKASKAEHEKSHLPESYGALISSMEYEFQCLSSTSD